MALSDVLPVHVLADGAIRFHCRVPDSKKNRRQNRGYGRQAPSPSSLGQQADLRYMLGLVLHDCVFASEDVRVEITYLANAGMCEVTVSRLRDRPKGFTGRKRDLGNIPDVILDAMEGTVFQNDNQVAELVVRRDLSKPEGERVE